MMKSFVVHTFNPSSPAGRRRKPPRGEASLLARLKRGKPMLLGIAGFLLSAALACRELTALLREPPQPPNADSPFGFFLTAIPGAERTWLWLALAVYAASAGLLIAAAYRGRRWLPPICLAGIALAMEPLYRDLRGLDLHWLALLCLALSFLLLRRGWSYCAGLALGAAVLLQPTALAAAAFFLWRRQFVYAGSALAFVVLYGAAGTLLSGSAVFPFAVDAWLGYAVSYTALWPALGLSGSALPYAVALDAALLAFIIACLPTLRHSAQQRFDCLTAAACAVWFTPAVPAGGLTLALACYLLLGGIVAERYGESAAPLRFAAPERFALAACGFSYLFPLAALSPRLSAWVAASGLEPLLGLLSAKLLIVPVCVLAWRLGRQRTRRTVRLADYRLRHDRARR